METAAFGFVLARHREDLSQGGMDVVDDRLAADCEYFFFLFRREPLKIILKLEVIDELDRAALVSNPRFELVQEHTIEI